MNLISVAADAEELLRRLERLPTAVISDTLDSLGFRHQVMAPRVRPVDPLMRVVGFARTVTAAPTHHLPSSREEQYKLQFAAIDSLTPGEVMVVSTIENCFWGELLSVAASRRGARGIVIDGYTRDVAGIKALGFPTFVAGIHAADALGRVDVYDFGQTITSGGVTVAHHDVIVGDCDGVVVVPARSSMEVIARAEEKIDRENLVRAKLEEGMLVGEAFRQFGIM
jgi:4-hydroxy-4-methyl-2-oxoglutarate aldolase